MEIINGSLKLDGYGSFHWWLEEQDYYNNTSTIGWWLTTDNDVFQKYKPWNVIDIEYRKYTVFNNGIEIASEYFNPHITVVQDGVNQALGEGFFTVQHNYAGEGSINIKVELSLGYTVVPLDGSSHRFSQKPSESSGVINLPDISVASTISSAGGTVGSTVSIVINKAHPSLKHTLYYSFGSLSGLIVEQYDGSRYEWTIPDEFASQFNTSPVMTCLIGCDTYSGSKNTGYDYTEIKIRLNEESGAPTLAPVVIDIKPETLALTGDEDTLIKHESMVEYAFNVSTWNNVPVNTYTITNGSKVIDSSGQGVIDDIESETFIFKVEDSFGFTKEVALTKNTINYVKPTCYIDFDTELEGITDAKITVKLSGKYYSGSFGLVDNTLQLEIRHTDTEGVMRDWEVIEYTNPSFSNNDNTYNIEVDFHGFDYTKRYTFQARLTDKLNTVISAQEQVQMLPVFDWSEEDFNFNVPVNLNEQTVLRHNKEANNTVLSASGGHIYLRPAGTDDTENETILYPDGSVEFSNEIKIKEQNLDYIIDYGTEAMGTNGTWYWEKWKSGKAVCYGCRNFGRVSTSATNTWRNWYVSSVFSQDFPSSLFAATPDYINIELRDADRGGLVVLRYDDNAPSASNSGSFVFGRIYMDTYATSATNVSFNIIGRWKD